MTLRLFRKKMSIENKVAETVLEKPIQVKVGEKTYEVPHPTLATIIETSALISELPYVDFSAAKKDCVSETLRIAKDFKGLEHIIALLILGAKKAYREVKVFGITIWRSKCLDKLAKEIKNTLTPKQVMDTLVEILSNMECAFFLITITSLNKVNNLKPTKGTKTTVSGQQSQE